MGRDKASIVVGGETLAARAARALAAVADPVVEVGPGRSDLPAVVEDEPGAGPLAAVAAGWRALKGLGHDGPVLVLAVDMPHVDASILSGLASVPTERSVIPRVGGRRQPLCARYAPADLDRIDGLLAEGARSMHALLDAVEAADAPGTYDPEAFADLDSEADLDAYVRRTAEWDNRGR